MPTVLRTTPADLGRIAMERGKLYDPNQHVVWCGECGAPLSAFGILHAPDCSGDDAEIRFRDLD